MVFIRGACEGIPVSARHGRLRSYNAALLLVLALLMASFAAHAGDLDKIVDFNIEAQTLDKALLEFGAQAHVQIMFASRSSMARMRTHLVVGDYTGKEALNELLKGSKMGFVQHGNTVEIVPIPLAVSSSISGQSEKSDPASSATKNPHGSRDSNGGQSDPVTPDSATRHHKHTLQLVVITGSRLRTDSKQGPQEVNIYDRVAIDQSGQNSISDFLSTLPDVSVTSPVIVTNFNTTVRLRGLPVGTTLVLLNGRRIESSGTANGQYFNLSNIPLAAVQRVEVDENGSSAVYGSDAIAGVVNVILKQNLDGFSANARYEWAKDVSNRTASVAFGKQLDRGGFSVIGSYELDGELLNSERALSASNDYSVYGAGNNNYPMCFASNVFSLTGAPLPGAPPGSGATYAAVSGSTTSGKPSFTYGTLNQCALLAGTSLLPSTRRGGVFLQGHIELVPTVTLFTELMYTHLHQVGAFGYQDLYGMPGYQEYTVSPSNPFNPFGTTVGVAQLLQQAPQTEDLATDFFRPLLGARGMLGDDWEWELSTWQSVDWTEAVAANEIADSTAIQNALDSSDPTTALNPFVTGPVGSPALIQSLFAGELAKSMGRDRSVEAFVRGPVLRTSAGTASVVVGGDYIRSKLYLNVNNGPGASSMSNYERRHTAVFGEARIPFIAKPRILGSGALLTATISGRHDKYNDFGGASTEQFGLEVRPLDGLLLRGNYGTAFDAPTLLQLYSPERTFLSVVRDPVTGSREHVLVTNGGNPALRPIEGQSHAVGIIYAPPAILGLTLSATQWQVAETNAIQPIPAQVIVNDSNLFSGRVARDAAGSIVSVNDTQANFGSIDVAGVDYQVSYAHPFAQGTVSFEVNVVETYHYRQALSPGVPSLEAVSEAEDDGDWATRWKGTVGVGWADEAISAHVEGRYTGSYEDYDSTSVIGNFWLVDANARWSVGKWLDPESEWLRGSYVEAGATNFLNRGPQFSNYDFDLYGYDAAQASILGRSLYLNIGVNW